MSFGVGSFVRSLKLSESRGLDHLEGPKMDHFEVNNGSWTVWTRNTWKYQVPRTLENQDQLIQRGPKGSKGVQKGVQTGSQRGSQNGVLNGVLGMDHHEIGVPELITVLEHLVQSIRS
jgi:hypothetical protein